MYFHFLLTTSIDRIICLTCSALSLATVISLHGYWGKILSLQLAAMAANWVTGSTAANQGAQHDTGGNFVLSDGSVQQANGSALTAQVGQACLSLGTVGLGFVFPR